MPGQALGYPAGNSHALCVRLLFIMVAQPVAKAHQAVAQMDVFHCDLRINDRKIIVAEVPEALNTQPNQLVRKVHGALARHAQHGDHRLPARTVGGWLRR